MEIPRWANTEPSMHFRKTNTDPSMHFRKTNTDLSMHFRKATTEFLLQVFKASALWADAFYKSNVRLSVRVFVRLSACSLLRYRFNVFLPPLPEVGSTIFLEIWNSWGKVMKRSGLRFEHFLFGNGLKLPRKKKFVFCWCCLTKHGGNNTSRWIRDLWSKGVSLILAYL